MALDAQMERICQPYPTQEACLIGMTHWVDAVLGWEKRSKIRHPSALSMCFPREIPRERGKLDSDASR
jgi:hypothetical protein